jgi:hypothetical protein
VIFFHIALVFVVFKPQPLSPFILFHFDSIRMEYQVGLAGIEQTNGMTKTNVQGVQRLKEQSLPVGR